ncbi:30S ribosomal protein S8 [Methylococcus sp. EFPC2]|uniref:30S ribosomal protein S8 n=1 Tax=Methylococcus sp. EFPC2 TaxID=2812648 RepID=UPI0019675507|nr:30S ribosomal protein S8 [Methylococcus sp. EFPC2]QSA95950.1 30S ribosomal protein S8 [Methylococcus sp. EFPC2]
MSMTDPLADMFTRIMNGQTAGKSEVTVPSSKLKQAICSVLKEEGYIESFSASDSDAKPELTISLKYYKGAPVIESYKRVSRPGRRVYKSKDELPSVLGGLGIAIVSTSKGVMAGNRASHLGQGGEVLCVVS